MLLIQKGLDLIIASNGGRFNAVHRVRGSGSGPGLELPLTSVIKVSVEISSRFLLKFVFVVVIRIIALPRLVGALPYRHDSEETDVQTDLLGFS